MLSLIRIFVFQKVIANKATHNKRGMIFVLQVTKGTTKFSEKMKKSLFVILGVMLAAVMSGCSSALFSSSNTYHDDLYAIHDRTQIARRQQAEAEAEKAAAEARRAEWEARIAEAEAAAAEQRYYEYNDNSYESILADTYESAYARRLRGFESPSYRMPSSYYNYRYGSAFTYVSAYDPAFYNVIVMGDQVWVEPKYITSMFGTWGTVVNYSSPWYYGWNSAWGPTFSFGSWGWSFGWNSWYTPWLRPWDPWYPWYNSWYGYGWYGGWGPGWHGGYGPGWHGYPYWNGGGGHNHHQPPYDPNRPNHVHRPGSRYEGNFNKPVPTYGGGSRPAINGSTSGNRGWNSGVVQGGGNRGNSSTSGSRGNGTSSSWNNNRQNSGSSSSSWNDRSNNRRSQSSGSSNSSYNQGTSRGNYGGGYGGGSSSSGGGSRSGSVTGSGSRGR